MILLRIALRVPARVREPLCRPFAAATERLARRRTRGTVVPALALVLRVAAGPRPAATALGTFLATAPECPPAGRRRLLAVAGSAGLSEAMAAIVAARPDDRAPELQATRARLALDGGRYADAVDLARAAVEGGAASAARTLELAAGQLAVLAPGWLPGLGPLDAELRAARPVPVPGRVLHVVSSSLPFRNAGYNVRTASVAACQRAAGLDPHIAVRTGYRSAVAGGGSARREIGGVPTSWLGPLESGSPAADRHQAEGARLAGELAREVRPSVLHAATDYFQAQLALAIREPLGIPVVYEVRGFWEETWASGFPGDEAEAMATDRYRLTRETETAAMIAADAVVTLSEVMRREIIERGCPPERVVIVPNAVEVDRFPPGPRDAALAASLGIGPDDPVVGYISSFNPYEGIPSLVEAAARLRAQVPRLKLLLVGDGSEVAIIRETARRLGLDDGTLVMPGRVPHDDILRYYSLIDVFVVPRTAHRVSRLVTPLKPYEAMALEKAVVVSDLPALREIVTPEETGLTFRPEDPDDLAAVLGRLLDDPALRRRLGTQARGWVQSERTWAANGRRYRELFETLGAV